MGARPRHLPPSLRNKRRAGGHAYGAGSDTGRLWRGARLPTGRRVCPPVAAGTRPFRPCSVAAFMHKCGTGYRVAGGCGGKCFKHHASLEAACDIL